MVSLLAQAQSARETPGMFLELLLISCRGKATEDDTESFSCPAGLQVTPECPDVAIRHFE